MSVLLGGLVAAASILGIVVSAAWASGWDRPPPPWALIVYVLGATSALLWLALQATS